MCLESKCISQVYVQDLREVMLYHGKRLKYPKNYHEIINRGEIIERTDSEGNPVLKLLYGKKDKNGMRPSWTLTCIAEDECHSKGYYTMLLLLRDPKELACSCFEPFGFSRIDLEKYLPVLDVKKTGDLNNPYQLVNTLYIAKRGCSVDEESGEVDANSRKEKGLNGKQLYNAHYRKQDPRYFVIRDERNKLELDKSILCFPICLFVYTVIFLRKLLTFLPMKLGECLLYYQNPISKILGNIFFTPFVPIKFIVDFLAIFIKLPTLLFVLNERKYADKYVSLWKNELLKCFHELKYDCAVIKNGKRPVEPVYAEYCLIGTWKELDVRHFDIYDINQPMPINEVSIDIDKAME